MNKLFHADNPFNRFMYKLGCLILVNIYFLLCCIPIVTIGASLTAADFVCYKMKEEPDVKITSVFFRAFASNFLNSTLVWIIFAGIMSALVYGFIWGFTSGANMAACILCAIGVIIAGAGGTFVFMLIARYKNTIMAQILNGFKVGFGNLAWTVLIWLVWAVPILVFLSVPGLLIYAGWLWLLCGFAVLIYVTAGIYRHIFKKLEKKED
ncbi:MAG: YesL family protein [Butyrivibrio sp.]|nr:YesL family protein [Butyrivibrio sp.]